MISISMADIYHLITSNRLEVEEMSVVKLAPGEAAVTELLQSSRAPPHAACRARIILPSVICSYCSSNRAVLN